MISEEQYQAIEDCGAAEMPLDETCEIVEITEAQFYADKEAIKRYRKGQLQTKLKIRQAVIRMAKDGVPQMAKIYKEFSKVALIGMQRDSLGDAIDDLPDDSLDDLPEETTEAGTDGK